jgi:N-acetylglucosamine kinase-like BadF-type ATPase
LVIEAAAAGDALAQQLIEQGMAELAQMVVAVARRLGWQDAPCAVTLTGGLWRAGEAVLAPFRTALAARAAPGDGRPARAAAGARRVRAGAAKRGHRGG